MSQENVELVRLAVEAYQRRDAEALRAITHEEGEVFTLTEGETEGEPFRGHAGIDEWLEHELDPWEEFRVEPIEIRAVGDRVLMRSRVTARGKGSSVELNAETGSVFEFRAGKIVRMRAFLDWKRALEAVGPPDQPA
jgi:ketosteroid isomerase-like protein